MQSEMQPPDSRRRETAVCESRLKHSQSLSRHSRLKELTNTERPTLAPLAGVKRWESKEFASVKNASCRCTTLPRWSYPKRKSSSFREKDKRISSFTNGRTASF